MLLNLCVRVCEMLSIPAFYFRRMEGLYARIIPEPRDQRHLHAVDAVIQVNGVGEAFTIGVRQCRVIRDVLSAPMRAVAAESRGVMIGRTA